MTRGLRDRGAAWWSIPAALSIGATLGFVAIAAPHWTHRSAIPLAISVRPEAAVGPASSATPRHHRHPHPAPTVTVTDTESPVAEPTAVTVITPSRPVVVATPTHHGDYGGGDGGSDDGHGGSDDGHDDGGGGHGGDN